MSSTVESRINAWECRFDNLSRRVTIAEDQITGIMESSRTLIHRKLDYCQVVSGPNKECDEGGRTLYQVRIEVDDGDFSEEIIKQPEIEPVNPKPYIPPLPFPEVIQIAKARRRVLKKVTEALQLIEESHKSEKLMKDYPEFKEHRDNLRACERWFKTRVGYYGMEKPYPVLNFPYDHFEAYLNDDEEPVNEEQCLKDPEKVAADTSSHATMESKQNTLAIKEGKDPGSFKISCLVNEKLVDDCVLDLGASKSVMPLHVSKEILIRNLEETDTPIVLADWSAIKPVGIARNVLVKVHEFNIPTDFIVIDTGDRESGIILGRPFLSTVGAEIKVRDKEVVFDLRNTTRELDEPNTCKVEVCSSRKVKEPPWNMASPSKDKARPKG